LNGLMMLLAGTPEGVVFALDRQTLIQIGIQLLNACVLTVALGFILYKPVRAFMRRRTERIEAERLAVQAEMAQAESLKAEYEQKLAEAEQLRADTLEAARQAAAERSRQIIEEARREATAIKRRSQENMASELARLKEETRQHIIEVASLLAGQLVAQQMDRATQDRLVEEALTQLEEATWPG